MTLDELNARLVAREEEMTTRLCNHYIFHYALSRFCNEDEQVTTVEEFLALPTGECEIGLNDDNYDASLSDSVDAILEEILDRDDEEFDRDDFYELHSDWHESLIREVKKRLDAYIKETPIPPLPWSLVGHSW